MMCAHPGTRSLPYAFRRVHFLPISGLGCALSAWVTRVTKKDPRWRLKPATPASQRRRKARKTTLKLGNKFRAARFYFGGDEWNDIGTQGRKTTEEIPGTGSPDAEAGQASPYRGGAFVLCQSRGLVGCAGTAGR